MKRAVLLLVLSASLHAAPARVLSVVEPVAAIGQPLTLRVDGDTGNCKALVLFIQSSPIHGLQARCSKGTVAFTLAVNEKNAYTWHRILGGHLFTRLVTVGLGPNDERPFVSHVEGQPFRILTIWRAIAIIVVALLLFVTIVVLRRLTSMLDSLARMQIAMWAVVIAASYAYIWSVTGETETINATALALVAIGAGTALGAKMIQQGKALFDAKTVVQTIANASSDELQPIEINQPTALHAMMISTWTVVLGIVFVATVFRFLEMPDFSTQVLAILGISGGTYLAFALQQRH